MLTIAFGCGTNGQPARVLYPDPTFNQFEALARAYGAQLKTGVGRRSGRNSVACLSLAKMSAD